jgi:hypothetical protein
MMRNFSSVRMSVYLTEELKAKMDEFEASFPSRVNWSEVAQRAFGKHIVTMKVNRTMTREAVIERLRVSREEELVMANASGLKEGRHWAETRATYADLRRLERSFVPQSGAPEDATIDWIVRLLDPERELGYGWEDLIEHHLYEEMANDPNFVEGFLTGALEVWEDVKDDVFEDS